MSGHHSDDVASPLERLRSLLHGINPNRNGQGFTAACPVAGCEHRLHVDQGDDGRAFIWCPGGHGPNEIVAALGLSLTDLAPAFRGKENEGGASSPRSNAPTPQHRGVTLQEYAE